MKSRTDKRKTKAPPACRICYGHGMWPDMTAPMGPMDASDGMPTAPCPECGADANPRKSERRPERP